MREPFILFRRPDGARNGKVFYVKFWDRDTKEYVSSRSVAALVDEIRGALPAGTSPITKAGARRIVELWLEDHSPAPVRGQTLTLQAYLKSLWADESQYATNLRARGRTISLEYLSNNRRNLNNYVLPWLELQANNIALQDFTAGQLEDLIMCLYKHGTVKTGTRDGKQIDTGRPVLNQVFFPENTKCISRKTPRAVPEYHHSTIHVINGLERDYKIEL